MIHISHYKFNKTHRFCIYIQPRLYAFLKQKSRGDISLFLEYLIQKHKSQLLNSKNMNALKNASCQYQPKTKDYKRIIIRKIDPELWKKLKELKSISGYSISFILRVFLEWEMESMHIPVIPLIPLLTEYRQQFNYPNFFIPMNNYECYQCWDRRYNEVFSIFWDFP